VGNRIERDAADAIASRHAPGAGAMPGWATWVPLAAGAYALLTGIVTLVGWWADVPRLTDWKNDGISMFPNTAAASAVSGLAVILGHLRRGSAARLAGRALGCLVAAIGGLTLFEHLSGVDLGIDTLLVGERAWGQTLATSPMRMGPPASVSFLSGGLALVLMTLGPRARRASAVLGSVVVGIGALSFTGHLYGASQMYTLPRLTAIAMQTASVVLAIGIGIVASVADREPMRTLLDRGAAGVLIRQALPLFVVFALALGRVRVWIEQVGLVDTAFGTALRTLVEILMLIALLWWAAGRVRRHEEAQQESEAAVRRQAQQLGAFLDTAAIAIRRVAPDGTILWANDAELRMLGYARGEYVGHRVAEFFVEDAMADILARLRRGERVTEYAARMRCRDGSIKHVLVDSSALWERGRFVHSQCFTRDVTDRTTAEETQARLAAIVESSDDAIVSKDLNGVITSWNEGAERLFGYTAAEAIGRPITMLMPPDRQDEEPGILERIRRGAPIEHYETVRQRKDGTLLDISLTVSPLRDGRGNVVGASKIARDITEWKRAQQHREELLRITEQAREEAEAANRAKDDFLAMLGHELRNPLSAVRNAISAATLDASSRERALTIARRQADQLVRIVDDLLDVARITRGRVPLRKERLSLGAVLQRAVDGARAAMDERGHALTLLVPTEPIHLEADAARVEQAVANLLANAAKYTDPGGKVTVSGEREGGDAVIRVRDNGIGIPPDLLPRVFDLFAQGKRSLERAEGGLGIGLTLVQRIIEQHGGTVRATSPGVGGGAEFVVRLPALPASGVAVEETPDARERGREQHPARVLMVEDNPDAAESLVMILELLGHHVRVVHDGLAALEVARSNVPDIMLVDIGLPGMNGYEVARAVRSAPELKNIVLVALTGYGRPEDKTQALAAGFDYHLVKPVDLDALGDLVAQLGVSAGPAGSRRGPATWH
jgi:PAS domain S-box-containing protein